ncbi:MAG: FtsW/RodA/SpoVE family cell cycle protein [Clostridia bacterium]|nr:FtsW/RodA/SpoVE family cell cycle protein [Clostridia bacterium]
MAEKVRGVKNIRLFGQDLLTLGGFDVPFFVLLLALLSYGLIMVYSASMPTSAVEQSSSASIFLGQLKWVVAGLVLMLLISQLDMRLVRKYGWLLYAACVGLCAIVLFINDPNYPGFHRWIRFGGFSIQPSEFMKTGLIVMLAVVMAKYHSRIVSRHPAKSQMAASVRRVFPFSFIKRLGFEPITEALFPTILCGAIILLPALLVIAGNHNSGAIILLLIGIVMLYIGDFKRGWFILGAVGFIAVAALIFYLYKNNPELLEKIDSKGRIMSWLVKDYASIGTRWQINNALFAIGSGGFLGVGLGNSVQKYYYVPEPQNDMIFSILCEELGFVGAALMLILFAALIIRGTLIGLRAKTRFNKFVAIGVVMHIGLQVVLNVAVVTEVIPNTGIGLPFFSSGGSAMLTFLAEAGLVLAVSKDSRMVKM